MLKPVETRKDHWFFGPILACKSVYVQVICASVLINLFALASSLYIMTVYDRVVPNNAIHSLWRLTGMIAVVILSDQDQVRDAALNMLRFFEDESCGQCTPCRTGCTKAVQLMQAEQWDKPLLEDLCEVMVDASICGLGQAAPNAIRLTMKHFDSEIS